VRLDEFDLDCGPVLLAANPWHAAAYEEFPAAKERMFDAAGADRRWGRRVAASMVAAGLVDVDAVPVVRQWRAARPACACRDPHGTSALRTVGTRARPVIMNGPVGRPLRTLRPWRGASRTAGGVDDDVES
jgi:hypothetical protein